MAERDGRRGSVLLLFPAAVLVFMVLGGLCVDFGSAYAARRQLEEAASAAANDAASRALDLDRLYQGRAGLILDGDARRVVAESVARAGLERLHGEVGEVRVSPDGASVEVTVTGRVPFVFGPALPGRHDGMTVEATATAEAARSSGQP